MKKVRLLYQYCIEKNIPVTVHCNDGGFIVGNKRDSERRTAPSIWENVLKKYPELKINFGHMGKLSRLSRKLFNREAWARQIIDMILKYDNVYTDFSYCGLNEGYYKSLRELIDSYSEKQKKKLIGRIMFGSDYMINLLSIDSYSQYIEIFSEAKSLSGQEKYKFVCENPEEFLFSKK